METQIYVDFLVCFAASLAACFIASGLMLTAWMAIFNSMLRYALDIVKAQYAARPQKSPQDNPH